MLCATQLLGMNESFYDKLRIEQEWNKSLSIILKALEAKVKHTIQLYVPHKRLPFRIKLHAQHISLPAFCTSKWNQRIFEVLKVKCIWIQNATQWVHNKTSVQLYIGKVVEEKLNLVPVPNCKVSLWTNLKYELLSWIGWGKCSKWMRI